MLPQQVVYVSIFTSLFAGYFYIKNTLLGKTKPNRISWFIWFVAPMIASFITFQNGGGISALPVFMAGFIPFLVLLASFKNKNAYWELGWLDYVCLFLSLISMVSWLFFKEGALATIFAILADAIAFIPTYVKSWNNPETETVTPYISGVFNASLSMLTVSTFSFITAGFAFYLFFGNLVEIVIVFIKRNKYETQR
jgi:hypothetical protein